MSQLVLVVDDDPLLRRLVAVLLREHDLDVVVAADGEQALSLAEEEPPALVILDRQLPGMHGDDVFRALRRHERLELREIPVLILSADRAAHTARLLGAEAGVEKPFDPGELVATAERLLRQGTGARQRSDRRTDESASKEL